MSERGEPIPRELEIPRNLFFTGTVNIDEITYMFSPKVLDRAFVLEFNEVDLRGYGSREDDEDQGGLNLPGFDGRLGLRGRGQPNIDGRDVELSVADEHAIVAVGIELEKYRRWRRQAPRRSGGGDRGARGARSRYNARPG